MVHGDAHTGNFSVHDEKVSVIDTETLFRSIDASGKGTSPAAVDVGRYYESIFTHATMGGLTPGEAELVQRAFLSAYRDAARGGGGEGLEASMKLYQANWQLIIVTQAMAKGADAIATEAARRLAAIPWSRLGRCRTRDWRRALVDAADAAGANDEGAAAVSSLAAFGNGAADQAAAAAVSLRTLLAALDPATRTQRASWAPSTTTTARACLRIVPRLIRDLDAGVESSVIAEHLASLAASVAASPSDGVATAAGWRCPRCGSRFIDEQHTDGTTFGRYIDLMCEACGLTAGFDEGAPDESTWRE